ncbi:MAG: hypothetical protein QW303_03060 [Nitrososphaerota archaeon]
MTHLSSSYVPCSKEGEICRFPGEDKSIAYANPDGSGPIYYRNNWHYIWCGGSTFKDQQPGNGEKKCYTANIPKDITFTNDNIPSGFYRCALEGDVCTVSGSTGPVDFLYGGGNKIDQYIYASLPPHTTISCSDTIFGEVKTPFPKACFIRLSNPSPNIGATPSRTMASSTNTSLLPGASPSPSFAPILSPPEYNTSPPSPPISVPPSSGTNSPSIDVPHVTHHRLTTGQIIDIIVGIFIAVAIIVLIIVLLKRPSWTR